MKMKFFSKNVSLLDMVNTTYIEGKFRLTRYRVVFNPYKRVKEQIPMKDHPNK